MFEINKFINYCNEMMIANEGVRIDAFKKTRKMADKNTTPGQYRKLYKENLKEERLKKIHGSNYVSKEERHKYGTTDKDQIRKKKELEKGEKDRIGKVLQSKVISYLKDYVKNHNFDQKYSSSIYSYKKCKAIKPDTEGYSDYGICISEFQYGIADEYIDKWEEKNPGKDWTKAPEFNNQWFDTLLIEGKNVTKRIFNTIPGHEKYSLEVETGDGDEGLIYIDIK